jgi:predicted nuclease with TOPRIM domain
LKELNSTFKSQVKEAFSFSRALIQRLETLQSSGSDILEAIKEHESGNRPHEEVTKQLDYYIAKVSNLENAKEYFEFMGELESHWYSGDHFQMASSVSILTKSPGPNCLLLESL